MAEYLVIIKKHDGRIKTDFYRSFFGNRLAVKRINRKYGSENVIVITGNKELVRRSQNRSTSIT